MKLQSPTLQPNTLQKTYPIIAALIVCCIMLFSSCTKDEVIGVNDDDEMLAEKPDLVFYTLSPDNQVAKYNAQNTDAPIASAAITGLQPDEKILAIDFRPATGQLYGLGTTSRIYVINYDTGAARAIGDAPFEPALNGEIAGFDFNPTVDRIRVVTNAGQNLRLDPETGKTGATDGSINGVDGAAVSAVAYSGNTAGSTETVLYDIDLTTKKLYKQMPPNDGTLVEVGDLGVDISGESGFDISPDGENALAALTTSSASGLYKIDLTTGKAAKVGNFGSAVTGIAIPTNPVAYAVCSDNQFWIFDPTNPKPVLKPITGLQPGETLIGLDMRPLNGQLFALGNTCRLYTINASSGAATAVGTTTLSPRLKGKDFGFDFNPTVDRIRIVSNLGENLRVNPADGVAVVDGTLNPGTPAVTAAAYTNNFAGATATMLFDIDVKTDKLVKQMPPNDGTLVEVGALGVDAGAANGFDIGGTSGKAFAILTSGSTTKIYSVNLDSGAATAVADFPKPVSGMTLGLGF